MRRRRPGGGHTATNDSWRTIIPTRLAYARRASPLQGEAKRREGVRQSMRLGLQLVGRAGAGGAEKQLASVRQSQVAAVGAVGAVFRLVAVDHHVGAGLQRVA